MNLPSRTAPTSGYPSVCNDRSTAFPAGSSTPGFKVTNTRATIRPPFGVPITSRESEHIREDRVRSHQPLLRRAVVDDEERIVRLQPGIERHALRALAALGVRHVEEAGQRLAVL